MNIWNLTPAEIDLVIKAAGLTGLLWAAFWAVFIYKKSQLVNKTRLEMAKTQLDIEKSALDIEKSALDIKKSSLEQNRLMKMGPSFDLGVSSIVRISREACRVVIELKIKNNYTVATIFEIPQLNLHEISEHIDCNTVFNSASSPKTAYCLARWSLFNIHPSQEVSFSYLVDLPPGKHYLFDCDVSMTQEQIKWFNEQLKSAQPAHSAIEWKYSWGVHKIAYIKASDTSIEA